MADKYQWCKGRPVPVVDKYDNHYCTFHAPHELKDISLEVFNGIVFSKIENAINNNTSCDLSGTNFPGPIDFSKFAKFHSLPEINFNASTFNGEVDFRCIFNNEVDFKMATFNMDVYFTGAIFYKPVSFLNTTFNKSVFFDGVVFENSVHFFSTTFNSQTNFEHNVFNDRADFMEAAFNGRSFFRGEQFSKYGYFVDVHIKNKIRLEGTNLKKVSFLNTDLRMIDFINCSWYQKRGRRILYDEQRLFFKEMHDEKQLPAGETKYTNFKKRVKKVEILYRRLKQKYKEDHDEAEASNWHYGEKEMYRKSNLLRRYLPSISTLYWLTCGYAERPVRAGFVLFVLLTIFTLLLNLVGIEKYQINSSVISVIQGYSGSFDLNKFDLLILTVFQHILFVQTPDYVPFTAQGKFFVLIFSKLLIPLQTTLFALSIRNRYRR
jgi:uncharacterized protein YjbI with pentapeptide repeats